MTRADLGLFAEHHFAAQAFRRGFRVSFAPGGIPGYDVVLDNGSALLRVQIKAASRRLWHRASETYKFTLGTRSGHRVPATPLSRNDCDVLALWMDGENKWSFASSTKFAGLKGTTITVGRRGRPGGVKRIQHAFGNWEIFDPVTQRDTTPASRG